MGAIDLPSLVVAWLTFWLVIPMYAAHCARPLLRELQQYARNLT